MVLLNILAIFFDTKEMKSEAFSPALKIIDCIADGIHKRPGASVVNDDAVEILALIENQHPDAKQRSAKYYYEN